VTKKRLIYCISGIALVAVMAGAVVFRGEKIVTYSRIQRLPVIDPDYSGTVIPPNIAPLNFVINENAPHYRVKIYAATGDTIQIHTGRVHIPVAKWKKLLQLNRNRMLTIDIYEKRNGRWYRFNSITNLISSDEVDGYLVYRKILGYKSIPEMAIRQRTLGSFDDRTVLNNRTLSTKAMACINCHSFCNNKPDNMIIHMRGEGQGMLLVTDKKVVKIDTRTKFNKGPASYASWHPSGQLIAFAVMKVTQMLHSVDDPRVVFDEASDLLIYNVKSNLISTHPSIADPRRMETLPEWSPDGRYLYFCSAPRPEKVDDAFYTNLKYREIKYDLMRVPFDIATGTWGPLDTMVSSRQTGLSNVQPKISPDGRYLLFVMMPYSYFAVYNDESDLYLLDLSNRTCRRLDNVNSNSTESFHSWSSNSRWFVFNSRRRDGLCGCPYFAHIDTAGNVSKPFILPQKDPAFYTTCLKSFNVPVLTSEPVKTDWRDLSKAAKKIAQLDPKVPLDGISGASARKTADSYVP